MFNYLSTAFQFLWHWLSQAFETNSPGLYNFVIIVTGLLLVLSIYVSLFLATREDSAEVEVSQPEMLKETDLGTEERFKELVQNYYRASADRPVTYTQPRVIYRRD